MAQINLLHTMPTPVIVQTSGSTQQVSIWSAIFNFLGAGGSWDEGWWALYRRRRHSRRIR